MGQAKAVGAAEFAERTDRYRPELLAHCYRMMGSLDEAEDLVQETYLRAWKYFDGFEERASVRSWLYKIATTTCLTALQTRKRRPLPSGLGAAAEHGAPAGLPDAEVPWLQPFPDSLLRAATDDPAAVVALRNSVRLAFVAALQHLSARQRAALVLREVAGWRAKEIAELLGASTAGVNSALQRARERLSQVAPGLDVLSEPEASDTRQLLDRYMDAFERADVGALAELLRADVELEMPPLPTWFVGRDTVLNYLRREVLTEPGRWRLVRTGANGGPAAALYQRDPGGRYRAVGIDVLTVQGGRIARLTAFLDPGLVAGFALPDVIR
ncbi:MAG: sigma-70 family RNA polymerase sigma factor [Mycobacteriaceae bacterium]|nr:sigma-70 family RNA polymerase sigma factor [Mycobacteriaceae bacterium]